MTSCPGCKRKVDEREVDWAANTCRFCSHEVSGGNPNIMGAFSGKSAPRPAPQRRCELKLTKAERSQLEAGGEIYLNDEETAWLKMQGSNIYKSTLNPDGTVQDEMVDAIPPYQESLHREPGTGLNYKRKRHRVPL